MAEEQKCQNCGQGFIPTCHITRQKYCSNECRYRYNNAKRYYKGEANICPECGETVEQRERGAGRWRRFCSDRCRVKYEQRKIKERRAAKGRPPQVCPNCGKEFQPEWKAGSRKYCSDACRMEWWREYHKANPSETEPAKECLICGGQLKGPGGTYCSRFCYLLAMDQTHVEETCEWCGVTFTVYQWTRTAVLQPKVRGIGAIQPEGGASWETADQRGQYRGMEGKTDSGGTGQQSRETRETGMAGMRNDQYVYRAGWAVRYHLKLDPYDGSIYVFRDKTGSMLKYIEWDGQGFLQGKGRAQSGSYPWPKGQAGEVLEITEKEFEYLLSKSIVPFKAKKDDEIASLNRQVEWLTQQLQLMQGRRSQIWNKLHINGGNKWGSGSWTFSACPRSR